MWSFIFHIRRNNEISPLRIVALTLALSFGSPTVFADPLNHYRHLQQEIDVQQLLFGTPKESSFPTKPATYSEFFKLMMDLYDPTDFFKRSALTYLLDEVEDNQMDFPLETGRDYIIKNGIYSLSDLMQYAFKTRLGGSFLSEIYLWAKNNKTTTPQKLSLMDAFLESESITPASILYRALTKNEKDELFGFWLNERFNRVDAEMKTIMRRPQLEDFSEGVPGLLNDYAEFLARIVLKSRFRNYMFTISGRSWEQEDEPEISFIHHSSRTYLEFARRELTKWIEHGEFEKFPPKLQKKIKLALAALYEKVLQKSYKHKAEMFNYAPSLARGFFEKFPELTPKPKNKFLNLNIFQISKKIRRNITNKCKAWMGRLARQGGTANRDSEHNPPEPFGF